MKKYPYIVIGAGAGGLVVSIGLAKAGKKLLLIEQGNYGGDCTNFGCIPSKSLIASAHTAHQVRNASQLGVTLKNYDYQTSESLERVRRIVSEVRSHEEPITLGEIGVQTITGKAIFTSPHTLKVNDEEVQGGQIIIATGSSAFIPPIPGLQNVPYLTNETIFDLKKIPSSLAILGGGPIGCELGQAFQRLGSQVSIIQDKETILIKDEPEAQTAMIKCLTEEGVRFYFGMTVEKISGNVEVTFKEGPTATFSHLLVATGRRPNLSSLNLDQASIRYTERGIPVDKYGRTNQKHIWAVGDVTGRALFTHVAENEGRSVLRNLLSPRLFYAKGDWAQAIPHVTYTDPEVASIGMKENEAIEKYGKNRVATYFVPLSQVDRAITAGETEGFFKVVTKKWSSRVLGACIVAPRAGEMLMEISLAMREKIPLRKLASLIHPYPTYGLGIRKAADRWLTETILPTILRK